ncbi:YdiU family protein [Parapusillimonas sp. SGNA-6]|nr:YdiU family protein [Parapusillimonas sp. SGNA-6]
MKDSLADLKILNSFAELPATFYTRLSPQPVGEPRLLHANADVARLLDLSPAALTSPEFLQVFSGQAPLPGGTTLSAVYSGHQFGVWAGQLGDGRAHLLGEVDSSSGRWELQLKGSGRTPYSRMGDGRAVLRSSVREYLAGEAMAGLGIPTTRALALVVSDDPVYRETVETAAIVTRVSPTFVRFGSFEHWSSSPENLQALLDYIVDRFYPACREAPAGESGQAHGTVLRFLREVVVRTARLIADWQMVGFCHGVMNTDNMSILGLTMDYGPYGFMDAFQANHVCNHSDTQGRYAWNTQPSVAHWNLYRLASSLLGLGVDAEALKQQLMEYEGAFLERYHDHARRKFGFLNWHADDDPLLDDWWRLLHTQRADFTLSFRRLAQAREQPEPFLELFGDRTDAQAWLGRYRVRLAREGRPDAERMRDMNAVNPLYVLRNHLAEEAIRAASAGDAGEIDTLLGLLRDPYTEQRGRESYAALPPEWACQLEVSCSS